MAEKGTAGSPWTRYLPQAVTILLLAVAYYQLLPENQKRAYIYYTVITYLAYTICANLLIPVHHRRGIRALRRQRYEEAIVHFRKSRRFFEDIPWLDRYRSLVLMASTAMSYREMAMMHTAVARVRLGDRDGALQACREVVQAYPANATARRIIDLMEQDQNG